MTSSGVGWKPFHSRLFLVLLLVICALELSLSARRLSQTWDEADHLVSGYRSWRCADFSFDPTHPPLAKLVAAAPLLWMPLRQAGPSCDAADVGDEFDDAAQFLYANDAERVLTRARLVMMLFPLALLMLLWQFARRVFGEKAALLATVLLVLEPNILAHGSLVNTDVALTAAFFAAVFAFYEYMQAPTLWKALLVGVAVGITLSSKFSGVVVVPVLIVLAAVEIFLLRSGSVTPLPFSRRLRNLLVASRLRDLILASATAIVLIWSVYGFHSQTRPTTGYKLKWQRILLTNRQVHTGDKERPTPRVISLFRAARVFPEPYLNGLEAIVQTTNAGKRMYLFGHTYETGQWFYFPASLLIKLTLPSLLLVVLSASQFSFWSAHRRQLLYLAIPAITFLSFSMRSALDIGFRHLLPVLPLVLIFASAGAVAFCSGSFKRAALVGAMVLWHTFSSVHAFPEYLSYANEAFGGPKNAYKSLSDSNVDWGQSLKEIREYLVYNPAEPCWFMQNGTADASYYQIPCDTAFQENYPARIVHALPKRMHGTVLVSAHYLSGLGWFQEFGSDPFAAFRSEVPVMKIGGSSVLVFHGDFDTHLLAAISASLLSAKLQREGQLDAALQYASSAASLAPEAAYPQVALCSAYEGAGKLDAAAFHCHLGETNLSMHADYNHDLLMVAKAVASNLQKP
ncbi:MAG TPA: glycosyltransferase family 39 protein [Terriglobales bacterium]|nr:glycosyltransferase family 39 protein [Terriglobales bacterium]